MLKVYRIAFEFQTCRECGTLCEPGYRMSKPNCRQTLDLQIPQVY